MKIKFYGVRGSFPVPGPNTMKYGGNTTCVTIYNESPQERLIFDAGTGIIQLGRDIISNFMANKESLNLKIFFTHLHPDHTQGFPFFGPNFFKNCSINLYGMETLQKHIGDILAEQMTPPTFPIEYRNLKSARTHHVINDGDVLSLNTFQMKMMQANAPSHPQQGAIYYRINDDLTKKSVACIWDNESKIGGDQAVINFAKGCDIMIHDTQYTSAEYLSNKMIVQGFGHSTYKMAIETALQAGVKKLVCIHYNPTHTDTDLDQLQKSLKEDGLEIILAKEGMEIDV